MPPSTAFCPVFGGAFSVRFVTFSASSQTYEAAIWIWLSTACLGVWHRLFSALDGFFTVRLAPLSASSQTWRAGWGRQLREWLNVAVFKDPITELEVPVEDVFVSNVGTCFGSVRLFEGRWQNNGSMCRTPSRRCSESQNILGRCKR